MDCKDGNDKTQTHGTDGYVANECGAVVKAPSAVVLQQHRSCGHLAVLIYMINSTPPHKLGYCYSEEATADAIITFQVGKLSMQVSRQEVCVKLPWS